MLSRLAREFAAEIRAHEWSDAPYRIDRAGHSRSVDNRRGQTPEHSPEETDRIRANVALVVAQVLGYADPNFDPWEFVEAAGVPRRISRRSDGSRSGAISNGLRLNSAGGHMPPGARTFPAVFLNASRVGSTTAVMVETDESGLVPDLLRDPSPDYPGVWERTSDLSRVPVAYRRVN